jgi:prepilin-type processing-associated H-X9-DG protein
MIPITRRPGGLTILELLVTVSVITLLVGLLLPAVLHARASARRVACLSNLRQWALAVHMYADTHDGRLPYRGQGVQPTTVLNRPTDWFNALPPLIENAPYIELVGRSAQPRANRSSVWICPEALHVDDASPMANQGKIDEKTFFVYAMNMALSPPFNGRPDHIEKVGPQQTMVFMADSLGPFCSTLPSTEAYSPIARHVGNTVNIVFLDGRAESYVGEEVGCGVGDPQRADIRWFPPNSKWEGPPKTATGTVP